MTIITNKKNEEMYNLTPINNYNYPEYHKGMDDLRLTSVLGCTDRAGGTLMNSTKTPLT